MSAISQSRTISIPAKAPASFQRFNLSQRIQHIVLMVSFTMLVITGITQRFYQAGWAEGIILALGGIESTRLLHRFFALLFTLLFFYHFFEVSFNFLFRQSRPTMLPTLKDAQDAILGLKYSLGVTEEQPRFGRFQFRQKFEYWGIIFGGIVMILSGFLLTFPVFFTRFLPGDAVPAAKEFHRNEAMLALLTITIWHIYGAHLRAGIFPFDSSIFTGKISRERMTQDHPLEYERLTADVYKGQEAGQENSTKSPDLK